MDTKPNPTNSTKNECLMNEISDAAAMQAAALVRAKEQGQPFILPWRQASSAECPLFESDASCGCGPAD